VPVLITSSKTAFSFCRRCSTVGMVCSIKMELGR
jgi:hypothetical protein